MGLEQLRAFPWIDYVVVGEGEEVFPRLVRHILEGTVGPLPAGVASRAGDELRYDPNPSLFRDFSCTGPPDYDDYFSQLEALEGGGRGLDRILLYEGSRGCWWGEKHHCTFCGLNAQGMEFRAKSPEQVIAELDTLSSRYDCIRLRFVDNIIDMKYVDGLFGKLGEQHLDFDVFIETKSNLGKRQIQTLARGGVKSMQPGIESLSANQLKEMDKGVSPMQNLQCLKWSAYYEIHVSWNILLGFPLETDEDYRSQLAVIPSILHFQPPEGIGKLWLERFSPYFKWPERYGIRITGPGLAYQYVYDERIVNLNKIAYDFEYEVDRWRVDPSLFEELNRAVQNWQRRYAADDKPFLYYSKAPSYVTIYDGRGTAPVAERFEWPEAGIIDTCNEQPKSRAQVTEALASRETAAENRVTQAIEGLIRKRILYEQKGKYFTLALPMNRGL
jgi:ribosomal peptide maturation radical SAM protein 1